MILWVFVPVSYGQRQAAVAPTETWLAKSRNEQVGHHPGVTPVAVGKSVDGYQAMMEADGDFIGRKAAVLNFVLLNFTAQRVHECTSP